MARKNQNQLLADIKAERAYQDGQWGGEWTDNGWTATDWDNFIAKYKANALVASTNGDKDEFVRQMTKVAALALAAAEAAERNGTIKVR